MMELLSLLPPFWREDPALKTLLEAIGAAVDDYLADADALLHSGAASTAQEPFLGRWEALYGTQKKDGETLPDRRSAVMSKMRAGGVCTPDKLKVVAASFYGGEVEVRERIPDDNTFTIKFIGQQGTPAFLGDLTAALTAVAPAHLSFLYEYRYLLIREVSEMTLEALSQTNLDYFAGG